MTKNILIYSKKIAKASETFVIDPAMALQRYHAYFVASLRRYDLPVPDERVFVANTGQGKVSLAKQRLKRYLFGHNGILFLSNQLRQLNPHLLQAHFAHEAVNAMPLAKKLNIPFIIYFHGLDATITSSATAGNAFWENYFAKLPLLQQSADLVLTHSAYLGQRVIDMGFDADRGSYTVCRCFASNSDPPQPRCTQTNGAFCSAFDTEKRFTLSHISNGQSTKYLP